MADTMKMGLMGMTGHWIWVTNKGQWLLEACILTLHALSGDHSGNNLGCYVSGLCDHMGLMGKDQSKVSLVCTSH